MKEGTAEKTADGQQQIAGEGKQGETIDVEVKEKTRS